MIEDDEALLGVGGDGGGRHMNGSAGRRDDARWTAAGWREDGWKVTSSGIHSQKNTRSPVDNNYTVIDLRTRRG